MDALQSRGMSLDRAGDGKCTLRALSRPPAPRDVLLRERPGVWPSMALLDDRSAHEVWGNDSSTLICSSLMPAGKATSIEGGFRLNGRWRYASCCDHCDWALLGALVDAGDGGPPQGRVFLVPRRDYQSVDTWQVSGLQATGSWDVIVDDVLVPAHRTQSMHASRVCRGRVFGITARLVCRPQAHLATSAPRGLCN